MKKALSILCSIVLSLNLVLCDNVISVKASTNEKSDIKKEDRLLKATESVEELRLVSGVTYVINNNTGSDIYVEYDYRQSTGAYSILSTNSIGVENYFYASRTYSTTVKKGEIVKISNIEDGKVVLKVPEKVFSSIKKETKPVVFSYNIKQGKNYLITNNTGKDNVVQLMKPQYTYTYDYLIYDSSKEVASYSRNEYGDFKIEKGKTFKIQLKNADNKLYIPYYLKDKYVIREVSTPVFYTYNLQYESKYEITNKTGREYRVLLDDQSYTNCYDYVTYDSNKLVYSSDRNGFGSFNLSNARTIRMDMKSKDNIIYIPYDYKAKTEFKKVSIPVYKTYNLSENKKYEFRNRISRDIKIILDNTGYNSGVYDYINYDKNGHILDYRQNDYGHITLKDTKTVKLDMKNKNIAYILYDDSKSVEFKQVLAPVFYDKEVMPGQKYTIKNTHKSTITLLNTSSYYGDRYNATIYDKNGVKKNSYKDAYGELKLASGEKVEISLASGNCITVSSPYEAIIREDFNGNKRVDLADISLIASQYHTAYDKAKWDFKYDLNGDKLVDLYDLVLVGRRVQIFDILY